jgi:hypothetical protein
LARLQLKSATERMKELSVVRDRLYAKVGELAGRHVVGNIRLVDKEKGLVVVE